MSVILDFIAKIIGPVINGAKWLLTLIYARKEATAQQSNEQLEKTNEDQKKQLKIAARPPSKWAAILERMRRGER